MDSSKFPTKKIPTLRISILPLNPHIFRQAKIKKQYVSSAPPTDDATMGVLKMQDRKSTDLKMA